MKKTVVALLVTSVWFLSVASLSAQDKGSGSVKGRSVNYVKVDSVRYVAIDEAAGAIGLTVSGREGIVNLEGAGRSVRLMPGKRVAIVDSGFRKFRGPVRNIGGKLYVPEDFLDEVYRAPLSGGREEKAPEQAKPADPAAPPVAGTVAVELPKTPTPEELAALKGKERVTDLTLDAGAESTSLYLDFDRPVEKAIKLKKSDEGKTLTVTFTDLASDPATKVFPVDSPWLESVKYIRSDDKTVIVKITGRAPIKLKAYNTGRTRLRISIEPETPALPAADNPELSPAAGTAETSLAAGTTEVDVAALRAGLEGIRAVIAIDPGHGGSDFGVAPEGRAAEKTIVLEVGRRLARLLELADQKPFLTRSGDYFLRHGQRVELVAGRSPALLVSLHCNASLNEGADAARGMEIYYRDASPEAESAPGAAGASVADEAIRREVRQILASPDGKAVSVGSRALAESIMRFAAASGSGLFVRGARSADVLLLREAGVPGVHIELGFLTSPVDARSLEDPRFWDEAAESLFRGIKDHLIAARSAEGGAK